MEITRQRRMELSYVFIDRLVDACEWTNWKKEIHAVLVTTIFGKNVEYYWRSEIR